MAYKLLRHIRLTPHCAPYPRTFRPSSVWVPSRLLSAGAAGPTRTNRLTNERSPYLQEHKHNPVDWYPWGEEAFKKAREQNKPIFLSIGYSTCHWCHVMNRESFESEETARIMNEHFINVKVDREERPNVDKLYMAFVQSTTGHGGWPMSVFLTPDLKPFFGGTYFPPVDAYQTPAFPTVLKYLSDKWETDQQAILNSGEDVVKMLRNVAKHSAASDDTQIDAGNTMERLYDHYAKIFDFKNGGLGNAPKFPTSPILHFFSRYYAANRNPIPPPILDTSPAAEVREEELDRRKEKAERSAEMLCHTLRNVALGGIHDHLGGGFHRYSVDAAWHVPHFEKMIYDQAQLLTCYLEAYSITGDEHFANVAKGIILYIERDITHPEGGFYSAQDADSLPTPGSVHKVEGAYYVWTKKEIEDVLRSPRDVDIFCHHYGVRMEGNVEKRYDPHGELEGKNILTLRHTFDTPTSDLFHLPTHELETLLASHRRVLLSHRSNRPPPHRDDKVVTAWNALAVSALARAGLQLRSGIATKMATRAAEFARARLWDARRGRLMRCWYGGGERDGVSEISGFADDYANMIRACLDLYEVGWDERWVEWAAELQEVMVEGFWDDNAGGFFGEAEEVGMRSDGVGRVARLKDDHDGAEPAANSVAVSNLIRLSKLLDNPAYARLAERTARAFYPQVKLYPQTMPSLVAELAWVRDGGRQIIFQTPSVLTVSAPSEQSRANPALKNQLAQLRATHFLPFTTFIHAPPASAGTSFVGSRNTTVRAIAEREPPERLRVYPCEAGVCKEPVEEEAEVERAVLEEGLMSEKWI